MNLNLPRISAAPDSPPPPPPRPAPVEPGYSRLASVASWVWLALALVWVVAIRVPLILNAQDHLDSDLAVDGLTLVDALHGHFRWHYPATPFIGTPPVLLSLVQAWIWGANPATLTSGGVVAWCLLTIFAFLFNRRAFGPLVASWGLVPLTFASTGMLWLSSRVTGGHLLAAAWNAGAFALACGCLARGGALRAFFLGLWCGVGLWIDSMFAATLPGLVLAVLVGWGFGGRSTAKNALLALSMFGFGLCLGVCPRAIGERVDPHDAYVGQFSPRFERSLAEFNLKIMGRDCLPRLISGHRLPGLQAEPDPATLGGIPRPGQARTRPSPILPGAVVGVSFLFAGFGLVGWLIGPVRSAKGQGMRLGVLVTSAGVVAAFLISPNITNSDNYRYLVYLLLPLSSGVGLFLARMQLISRAGLAFGLVATLGFAGLMTLDSTAWYQRLGWVDARGVPVVKPVSDPVLDWFQAHPDYSVILGDYWDVYRLSFLLGGVPRGLPFPEYPRRFLEDELAAAGDARPRVVLARPGTLGVKYRALAQGMGSAEVQQGDGFSIVIWPQGMKP